MTIRLGGLWAMAAVVAASCVGPREAGAQAVLEQLEKRLAAQQQAGPGAPPLTQPEPPKSTDLPPVPGEEPGYLGVFADDVDTQGRGVRLVDVMAGGPAALGGLKIGDLITSIDGVAIANLSDFAGIMKGRIVNEEVTFVVLRNGEAARLDIVLTKRPPPEERKFANFGRVGGDVAPPVGSASSASSAPGAPQPNVPTLAPPANEPVKPPATSNIPHPAVSVPTNELPAGSAVTIPVDPNGPAATAARTGLLGIRTERITPELQLAMNLPEPRGALVIEVRPDSPAKLAGIPIDAVIVAVDAKRINAPDDLMAAVRERGPGAEVRLSYYRYGQLYERRVKLAAPPPAAGPVVMMPQNTDVPPVVGPAIVMPNRPPVVEATPSAMSPALGVPSPSLSAELSETVELRRRVEELEQQVADLKARLEAKPANEPRPSDKK